MSSVESDATKGKDQHQLLVTPPAPISQRPISEEPDYWAPGNRDLIVASQPATCIYFNSYNQIVIRQESVSDDPDMFVRITPAFLGAVIKRLTAMQNEVHE